MQYNLNIKVCLKINILRLYILLYHLKIVTYDLMSYQREPCDVTVRLCAENVLIKFNNGLIMFIVYTNLNTSTN